MIYVLYALIFALGVAFGSFINALEYRITEEKSIGGRSFCPNCKHQLVWYDLFPILSYVILLGKCRYCHKKISFQYPLIELVTGFVFLGMFYASGYISILAKITSVAPSPLWFGRFAISSVSLVIICFAAVLVALHDAKTTYILSQYVYAGIISSIIYNAVRFVGVFSVASFIYYWGSFVLAAGVPALVLFSLYFFSKGRWMGNGDYELALFMGFFLGIPLIVPAYYLAFFGGSIVGLVYVYIQKTKKLNSAIAFGPFLMAGMVFAAIFGQQIIDIYARIFLGY